MMQNIYPLFERNRVLKKELLWSMRDYTFSHVQLEYQEYGQGILRGCDVTVQGNELVVGPGMIKYGKFIYLLMDEEKISYTPSDQIQYLRLRMEMDTRSPDVILYQAELLLTSSDEQKRNEFELCRFNLRKGAQLRTQYTSFEDMKTEYDTINLIHANWGALGGETISPIIMRYFAKTILSGNNSQQSDCNFAYLCLSNPDAMPRQVLLDYLGRRTGCSPGKQNLDLFWVMCMIIDEVCKSRTQDIGGGKMRHKIFVD